MYTIETAKMSSKGQLVMPDSFRRRYGWSSGMTLLLIGTSDSVVVQSLTVPSDEAISRTVRASHAAAQTLEGRLEDAKRSLAKLKKLGISMPSDFESSESVRARRAERYA